MEFRVQGLEFRLPLILGSGFRVQASKDFSGSSLLQGLQGLGFGSVRAFCAFLCYVRVSRDACFKVVRKHTRYRVDRDSGLPVMGC